MNKTININLGGIFFHIDEIAYQKLKGYLDSIRRSLSDDPKGRDEIITDIESRIGEILSERIKDVRQVINEQDIDEVIEVMGKPEDYMVDDEIFNDDSYGNYSSKKGKKLYRDGGDRFLGGVSSGMAHYLNIDVIWIRLGWLVAAFGFGFGFIVYPLLWILLPEANTTAEKLEMEGAEVNITNIEKKIRDEISDASTRVKHGIDEVSDKVKNADYKKYGNRAKSGSQDLVDTLGKVFVTIFMIIGKFIGVLLIIVAVTTILGMLIGMFTLGSLDFIHDDWLFRNSEIYNNSGLPIWFLSVLTFVLIAIPFFFLFALGLRILSNNAKSIGKTTKLSLLGIWIVTLLVAIFFGTRQFMNSAYDGTVTNSQEIYYSTTDTLEIKMVDNKDISNNSKLKRNWRSEIVLDADNQERIYSNNIRLNILQSDDTTMYAKVRKLSQGQSRQDARENADLISHAYELNDEELRIDGFFLADLNNRFSEQRVYVDLYLPEDQIVYLDNSTRTFLYDVNNVQNIYDDDMAKHYFQMTKDGFACLDCEGDVIHIEGDDDSFNMKIDEDGVHIEIQEDGMEKSEVKIDASGVVVKSVKDSV
ncbi:PspC domain-containing protein [Lutimonas halocynthiae]|uniref:PspC domain-containing protein n=1 Tax=Lutimonas halocynthiae TaxID=1446477 RepID=UPI0025B51047|nr:PspC domain-containing protein [Lutimonas halocynthiae]MDN3643526.1 PspC domain-containing protein [Lutimonas halocynthiae]